MTFDTTYPTNSIAFAATRLRYLWHLLLWLFGLLAELLFKKEQDDEVREFSISFPGPVPELMFRSDAGAY